MTLLSLRRLFGNSHTVMSYVAIRAIARIMPDIKSTYSPDLIRREFIECITQK